MNKAFICTEVLIFTIFCCQMASTVKGRSGEEDNETDLMRRGGLSSKQKKNLKKSKIYISPAVRDKVKLDELEIYTVCRGFASEVFNNFSTKAYSYYMCPDEINEFVTVASAKDFCCYNASGVMCCNRVAFQEYTKVQQAMVIRILWKIALFGGLVFLFCFVMIMAKRRFCPKYRNNTQFQTVTTSQHMYVAPGQHVATYPGTVVQHPGMAPTSVTVPHTQPLVPHPVYPATQQPPVYSTNQAQAPIYPVNNNQPQSLPYSSAPPDYNHFQKS